MASAQYYGEQPQQQQYYGGQQYGGPPQQNQYQPPQQDQYQPPSQPPPTYGQQQSGYEQKNSGTFEEAFKIERPRFNDLWAAILLLVVFAGFIVVSGITLNGYDSHFTGGGIYHDVDSFGLNSNTMILFAFVLVCSFVLSWGYVTLARYFPKQFIWVTGILNIVFAFVTAIYMLSRKYWSGGIVFLIFAIIAVVLFISWIPRIPFSALMLRTVIDVSKRYGHVYLVSLLGGLLATAFGAWYSVTLVGIYAKYEPGNSGRANPACAAGNGGCSSGKVIGLLVFITFAMYWISEVLKNVIHTTISGVYGSWYFQPNNFPKGATRGALKRSLTYSFGSISFGSLVVALINMLRQACSIARNQYSQDGGNIVGVIAFWVLGCLINLLDWAVQFVNRYAFSHIALYGKAYIPAAKDTWRMIKDRGIDALVSECLIGPVLTMGGTFVAYFTAFLSYLYILFTAPAYNSNGGFTPVVVAFGFLVGLQIANIFTTPISSGIDTLFVAMAWDPQIMAAQHSELYREMVNVYPHVQQALTV